MINKWIPRGSAILFAALISMFAADASGFRDLLIQLIPVYIVLLGFGLGWKWPKVGATVFFVVCVLLIPIAYRTHGTLIVIDMSLVQGLLFWFTKKKVNV